MEIVEKSALVTMEEERKFEEKLKIKNNNNGGNGATISLQQLRLKQLKKLTNMIFIKKFDINKCQGESDMLRNITKIKGINRKKFIAAINHTRITRDNRVFVIVFDTAVKSHAIKQWANTIDKTRINALGDDYQAFKYDGDHYNKLQRNTTTTTTQSTTSVVIKGLRNETPLSVTRMFKIHGYTVCGVKQWNKFNWFTVVLSTNKEATKAVSTGSITFGTQLATIEFLKPRKLSRRGPPIQCKNCQKFGHRARFCTNNTRCKYCGKKSHKSSDCFNKRNKMKWRCCNCHGKHPSNSKDCPKYHKICERIGYKNKNNKSPRDLHGVAILRNGNIRGKIIRKQQQQLTDAIASKQQPTQPNALSFASVAENKIKKSIGGAVAVASAVSGSPHNTNNLIKNSRVAVDELNQKQQRQEDEKEEEKQLKPAFSVEFIPIAQVNGSITPQGPVGDVVAPIARSSCECGSFGSIENSAVAGAEIEIKNEITTNKQENGLNPTVSAHYSSGSIAIANETEQEEVIIAQLSEEIEAEKLQTQQLVQQVQSLTAQLAAITMQLKTIQLNQQEELITQITTTSNQKTRKKIKLKGKTKPKSSGNNQRAAATNKCDTNTHDAASRNLRKTSRVPRGH